MYYILEGHKTKKVDVTEWGEWFGTADRVVKKTEVKGVTISTVFLGLDHSFTGGPPLIFETMVFEGSLDGEMSRYTTWKQAEEGRVLMVRGVEAMEVKKPPVKRLGIRKLILS